MEANRKAWAMLSAEHFEAYRKKLINGGSVLSETIRSELGDVGNKDIIHLQCNTGADTISLARLGAKVTGVDLVPENIEYAAKLAADCDVVARFIESNVLTLMETHSDTYDVVFTTEGVLCWLPDLHCWARNVRHLLKDDGFLYLLDSHPFYMCWDEKKLPELFVKYPYFSKNTDEAEEIGGYASGRKQAKNYSWMYTMGEVITALGDAGLHIEWLHEFDWLYFNPSMAEDVESQDGKWYFREHRGKLPFAFSLKATVR